MDGDLFDEQKTIEINVKAGWKAGELYSNKMAASGSNCLIII